MNILAENVTKKFGKNAAILQVSFELTEGVYGLIGAKHAGKTTLLNLIANIIHPTSGAVYINGIDQRGRGGEEFDILGYLPQTTGGYSSFTAEQFLSYIALINGVEEEKVKNKVKELLEWVNLTEFKKMKLKAFTEGMKMRLAMAQAVIHDPSIVLMDEPTTGLNEEEADRFRYLLSDIAKERIILLATHRMEDLEDTAKEILILKDGKLIQKETPQKLKKEMGHIWRKANRKSSAATLKDVYHYYVNEDVQG